MAEYWKSTPKYWCKFCSIYVKDTKFERAQHEATGRHQGSIQRSLRGLHRDQQNEQRTKERAQAEVARLNGIVGGKSVAEGSAAHGRASTSNAGVGITFEKRVEKQATLEDRKRQWSELAAMGIAVPEAARADLALAGDWQTVSQEVVGVVDEEGEFKPTALNRGVHKRKLDEDEEERKLAEETVTRRKGWGETYKRFPGSGGGADDELEGLFGEKRKVPKQESKDSEVDVKVEDGVKAEVDGDEGPALQSIPTADEAEETESKANIKTEEDVPALPKVTFKKRKKAVK